MRWGRAITILVFIYTIFSLVIIFISLQNWSKEASAEDGLRAKKIRRPNTTGSKVVEIWGKAAIGLYLWQHIFDAPLEKVNRELEKYGEIQIGKITLTFRTGFLVTPENVDKNTENAILVINGREQKKVDFAVKWLNSLKSFTSLKNLGVVLLGNERCENDWLMPYMVNKGGIIKFAFVVYDIPYMDRVLFHQWPLGVATYRNFPVVHKNMMEDGRRRKYLCNFIGTVYKDSSREELLRVVNMNANLRRSCLIHIRNEWVPHETEDSSKMFYDALKNSELTLCPVGKNTECYRIYEAISLGSVPVIEDIMTPGSCGKSTFEQANQTPLRVLKDFNAPLIYIKTWKELPNIIAHEMTLSDDFVLKRRKSLLRWYQKFKYKLRNDFLAQLKKGFKF